MAEDEAGEEPTEVSDEEVEAFGAKLQAFADDLDPRERAMLAELLGPEGDAETEGFSFDMGLDMGLDILKGGTIMGAESGTSYNRWNRTTKPDPPPWKRWNRTTKFGSM